MPKLSAEQVKALAPDVASFKAGQSLADARHWPSLGANDAMLWGECKGSGKEPYKTSVDLNEIATSCSCPSHKFPCKHALGLMLLAAASPAKLTESTPPAWAAAWLEKRTTRKQSAAKPVTPADEATRQKEAAKRAAKREKLVETGLESLEHWLADFARIGLASAQSAPKAFWDEQAARMIDAQLPGAARSIREMSTLPATRPDWAEMLLLRLARLHLLTQAYRKLEKLPAPTQDDVRTLLGWNINQDELQASTPGIVDDWLVLASHTEEDEKTGLRPQSNWLYGRTTQRSALILNFAHRSQPLDTSLIAGLVVRGELVYFPGAYPLRAIFKQKQMLDAAFVPTGLSNLTVFQDQYASALGINPWLEFFPAVLENLIPVSLGPQRWFLRDSAGLSLPLSVQFNAPWELFAFAGGHPLTVSGVWDGFVFMPFSAWVAGRSLIF